MAIADIISIITKIIVNYACVCAGIHYLLIWLLLSNSSGIMVWSITAIMILLCHRIIKYNGKPLQIRLTVVHSDMYLPNGPYP